MRALVVLLPEARVVFRAAVLLLIAACAALVYALSARTEIYVLALFIAYMAVQQLIATTLYGWIDKVYWATLGRNVPPENRAPDDVNGA